MPTAGFKPAIPAGERPQTDAFDRATSGTGLTFLYEVKKNALWGTTSFRRGTVSPAVGQSVYSVLSATVS